MKKYDIFISYSRKDSKIAQQICHIFNNAGISYFIDIQDIGGAMEFPIELANAICNSKLFLFLASKNSYCSKFTINELTFAFNELPRHSILPYIIDGTELPRHLRFVFAGINWRNIKDHPINTTLVNDIKLLLNSNEISLQECHPNNSNTHNSSPSYDNELFYRRLKLAKRGVIEATKIVIETYINGKGLSHPDPVEAAKWCLKLAEAGNEWAQFNLGLMYAKGFGVNRSKRIAEKWFLNAAANNYLYQLYLSIMYDYGIILSLSPIKAFTWLQKAADSNFDIAMMMLGSRFIRTNKDFEVSDNENNEKAFYYFNKAAELDKSQYHVSSSSNINVNLGYMYYKGLGVSQNKQKAIELWGKDSSYDDKAMTNLKYAKSSLIYRLTHSLEYYSGHEYGNRIYNYYVSEIRKMDDYFSFELFY